MKPILFALLAFSILLACPAHALTIDGDTNDCEVQLTLSTPPYAIADLTATTLLQGTSGGGTAPYKERSAVMVFQLPSLGAVSKPFKTASFTFNYESKNTTIKGNLDLYGLGRRASPLVLVEDYWTATSTLDPTDATLVDDNILTVNSTAYGLKTTSGAGALNLATYLNTQYAGGQGAGQYVFLRLSTDAAQTGGTFRYTITSAEGAIAANDPTIRPRIDYTLGSPPQPEPPLTVIASDSFDTYTSGTLAGKGAAGYGWAGGWVAGAASSVTANSGATLVYAVPDGGGLIGSGRSVDIAGTGSGIPVTRTLTAPPTGTFYAGCLMKVSGSPNTGDAFAFYLNNSTTDTASGVNVGLCGNPTTGDYFFLSKGTTIPSSGALCSVTGSINETRYLVLKVEKTAAGNYNKVTCWINPGTKSESTKPNGDMQLNQDLGVGTISRVLLRASALDSGDSCSVDALTVAQSFLDLMVPAGPGPDSRALVPLIQVEATATGSANSPLPSQSLASGQSVSAYAIERNSGGSFVSNTPVTWRLTDVTGSILSRDLVVSADGKSAVFTANGAGTARIMAVGNATNLSASGLITVLPRTNVYSRPFIWTRMSERDGILEKIRTNGIAAAQFMILKNRADAQLASYQANPSVYLRKLPLETSTGVPKFTRSIYTYTDDDLIRIYNAGVDCSVMYHLTGNENYARCAAAILRNSVKAYLGIAPETDVGNGAWIYLNGWLGEAPVSGWQMAVIHDYLYDYLKAGATVYQLGTTNGSEAAFSFTDAQQVFRTFYTLARDHGQANNNWSVAEAQALVPNALALDDTTERSTAIADYLVKDNARQTSLKTDAKQYPNPGDIWPESLDYSEVVNIVHPFLMVMLDRYDPTLNLFGLYPNVAMGMARPFQLAYPNGKQIHFGDFHHDDDPQPFFQYEVVYRHAAALNLSGLRNLYGPAINAGIAALKYDRSKEMINNPLPLLWFAEEVTEPAAAVALPRTDTLTHAGVALQRNPSPTNNALNGLMCFVGGAGHVHSHANGMNMELYGKGVVLGAEGGRGDYGTPLHENYFRLYAAHNTVIVNGSSCGDGGWQDLDIPNVQVAAMEPAAMAPAVSPDLSFTCTTFSDTKGTLAEATQQRTMGIVRTSATTGYYVDIFRSDSSLPNEFHDYIYHNLGSSFALTQTNAAALPLNSQPNRFQTDIGDAYKSPGWRYFSNTMASDTFTQGVKGRYTTSVNGVATYMDLHMPGATDRQYAKADTPGIVVPPYNITWQTLPAPVLAIRQTGEAWNRPFAVVFEPHQGAADSGTVKNVTKLEKAGVVVGLKVESTVAAQNIVQYILSNVAPTDTYTDDTLGIAFTGRYAIITDKGNGTGSLYVGDGASLQYQGRTAVSQSGASTQFNVAFTTDTNPTVTANAPVLLPPGISTISDQVLPLNSRSGAIPFTIGDLNTATTALQLSVASTNTQLVPVSGVTLGGSGTNRTVTITPALMQTGVSTITVTVSDGALTSTETFLVTVDELAFGRFAYLFNDNANFEGWTTNATAAGATVSAGALSTTLSGNDPQFNQANALNFPGNNVPTVLVRMKSSAGGSAQFFFGNELAGASIANSVSFSVPADSAFKWYAVNVAANTNWTGHTLKTLRLDPPNTTGTVSIDAIIGSDGDFDNDGIPDAWEATYQLDPTLNSDAQLDSDGDGITNVSEYIFGSNPASTNPASTPAISASGTSLTLTFVANQTNDTDYAGLTRYYDVETSADLSMANSWVGVPGYTNIPATGQTITINQPLSAGSRFYRLKVRVIP